MENIEKNFLRKWFIWFHEFFCLDFFKFSDLLWIWLTHHCFHSSHYESSQHGELWHFLGLKSWLLQIRLKYFHHSSNKSGQCKVPIQIFLPKCTDLQDLQILSFEELGLENLRPLEQFLMGDLFWIEDGIMGRGSNWGPHNLKIKLTITNFNKNWKKNLFSTHVMRKVDFRSLSIIMSEKNVQINFSLFFIQEN